MNEKMMFADVTVQQNEDGTQYRTMAMPDARKWFTVSSRTGGYSINGFHYARCPHIVIPDKIGKTTIVHVSVKSLPDDAIVYCSAAVFKTMTRRTKASTSAGYLMDASLFFPDQAKEIEAFIKKYAEDVAAALYAYSEPSAFRQFLEIAKPKGNLLDQMLEKIGNNTEIRAMLLEQKQKKQGKTSEVSELSLDEPKKMTVTELKKLWTYCTVTIAETEEKYIEITNYKGIDENVVVPASIGKLPVKKLSGIFPKHVKTITFEREDIEIRCSFRQCTSMADENGFIVVQVGGRSILTDYIGDPNVCSLRIPENVTENTTLALRADGIREVIFPEGYEAVPQNACYDCKKLQRVVLPESLKAIGQIAFAKCNMIQEVYIPAGVTQIGAYAFEKRVVICGHAGTAAAAYAEAFGHAFRDVSSGEDCAPLLDYVTVSGKLITYLGAEAEPVLPADITVIGSGAFQQNQNLHAISLPDGVTEIESQAFAGCRNLETVSLNHVRRIGGSAFNSCINLKEIHVPEGVEEIKSYTFSGCARLEQIYLPASVTTIADNAFAVYVKFVEQTIHAPAGSYAEQYAKENNIPFTVK